MNREVVIVGGMTGWGKTLWTKLYSSHSQRLLVFDPTVSFPNVAFDAEEHGLDDLQDSLGGFEPFQNEQQKMFRVGTSDPERVPELGAMSFLFGNNLLVLEESSMLFDKGQRRLEAWLNRIIFLGRHQRCSLCVIAQRFMSIPKDVRSQANRIVTFCQHEEEDVSYLKSVFGKDHLGKIPGLPRWSCLDSSNGVVYEYNIADRVEKILGIKLDKTNEVGYHPYHLST